MGCPTCGAVIYKEGLCMQHWAEKRVADVEAGGCDVCKAPTNKMIVLGMHICEPCALNWCRGGVYIQEIDRLWNVAVNTLPMHLRGRRVLRVSAGCAGCGGDLQVGQEVLGGQLGASGGMGPTQHVHVSVTECARSAMRRNWQPTQPVTTMCLERHPKNSAVFCQEPALHTDHHQAWGTADRQGPSWRWKNHKDQEEGE